MWAELLADAMEARPDIDRNSALCRSVLNDLLGADAAAHRREVRLLCVAVDEAVPAELASGVAAGRLGDRLMTEHGLDREASRFAVETWQRVLSGRGVVTAPLDVDPAPGDAAGSSTSPRELRARKSRRLGVLVSAVAVGVLAIVAIGVLVSGGDACAEPNGDRCASERTESRPTSAVTRDTSAARTTTVVTRPTTNAPAPTTNPRSTATPKPTTTHLSTTTRTTATTLTPATSTSTTTRPTDPRKVFVTYAFDAGDEPHPGNVLQTTLDGAGISATQLRGARDRSTGRFQISVAFTTRADADAGIIVIQQQLGLTPSRIQDTTT